MFNPVQPVEWIITRETIDRELQTQSDVYFARWKSIASKDDFVARTNETIEKLKSEMEIAREAGDLELVSKYEEGLKSHTKHLELLDFEMEQNQKDCDGAVEVVLYLKKLRDGLI